MCNKIALEKITDKVTNVSRITFDNKLKNIILYGSYARGDFDSESDIDIMIIVDADAAELVKYRDEISRFSSRLSLETEDCVTISLVLQDRKTFEKYKESLPYYTNILNEGVIIYAA